MATDNVAVLNSTSSHGGVMSSASGSHATTPQGAVCVEGDLHNCPIQGHGITPVTSVATKTMVNGKLVIINGSVAGCGAIINGAFATNVSAT